MQTAYGPEDCLARHHCDDLAWVTFRGCRKLLKQVWRPKLGQREFLTVVSFELRKILNAHRWAKKTYNDAVSALRCAFEFGYLDLAGRFNPASTLKTMRITKKDRRGRDVDRAAPRRLG